jgi:hypothetical protein
MGNTTGSPIAVLIVAVLGCVHHPLGINAADDAATAGTPIDTAAAGTPIDTAAAGAPTDAATVPDPPRPVGQAPDASLAPDAAAPTPTPPTGATECNVGAKSACPGGGTCFTYLDRDARAGLCVSLCEDTNQSAWGQACVAGDQRGTCLPFLWQEDPNQRVVTPTGICTTSCNPLAPSCRPGFSCDVTELEAGQMPPKGYACLPIVKATPGKDGDVCDGFPVGHCGAGLSCVPCIPKTNKWCCRPYCDRSDPATCAAPRKCGRPDWFPTAPTNVGVCSP